MLEGNLAMDQHLIQGGSSVFFIASCWGNTTTIHLTLNVIFALRDHTEKNMIVMYFYCSVSAAITVLGFLISPCHSDHTHNRSGHLKVLRRNGSKIFPLKCWKSTPKEKIKDWRENTRECQNRKREICARKTKLEPMSVSNQLPTHPSPNPTLTLLCYQLPVGGLREG